jgi:uncharacterized protein
MDAKTQLQTSLARPDVSVPGYKPSPKLGSDLEQACDRQDGDKCFRLARAYTLGEKMQKDLSRGATFFGKGCRAGHADSCTALGILLWLGQGIQQERALAEALWRHACRKGSDEACAMLTEAQLSAR